jgi:hypothetical protein
MNAFSLLSKISILSVLLGMISGCGEIVSKKMASDRYQIRANNQQQGNENAFVLEANKLCANRFSIIEQRKCGSDCLEGTVKCD